MIAYINSKDGATNRVDAESIIVDGVIRIEEVSSGRFQVVIPPMKPTTELVEMNFSITQKQQESH